MGCHYRKSLRTSSSIWRTSSRGPSRRAASWTTFRSSSPGPWPTTAEARCSSAGPWYVALSRRSLSKLVQSQSREEAVEQLILWCLCRMHKCDRKTIGLAGDQMSKIVCPSLRFHFRCNKCSISRWAQTPGVHPRLNSTGMPVTGPSRFPP